MWAVQVQQEDKKYLTAATVHTWENQLAGDEDW